MIQLTIITGRPVWQPGSLSIPAGHHILDTVQHCHPQWGGSSPEYSSFPCTLSQVFLKPQSVSTSLHSTADVQAQGPGSTLTWLHFSKGQGHGRCRSTHGPCWLYLSHTSVMLWLPQGKQRLAVPQPDRCSQVCSPYVCLLYSSSKRDQSSKFWRTIYNGQDTYLLWKNSLINTGAVHQPSGNEKPLISQATI